jgi:hypothetical protein
MRLTGVCLYMLVLTAAVTAACSSAPPPETSVQWVCDNYPDRVTGLFDALDLTRPGLEGVKAAVDREDWPAACDSLVAYYRRCDSGSWLRRSQPPTPNERKSGPRQKTTDKTMADVYEFGSVEAQVPRTEEGGLDWTYQGPNDSRTWALELHQHARLNDLARQYFWTGNSDYVVRVDENLRDWVVSNACPDSTVRDANWSALNAAGRIRQWDDIFYLLQNVDEFSPSTRILMLSSVPDHARTLLDPGKPVEWGPGTMTGLTELTVSWPEFRDSPEWLDTATHAMLAELDDRFYPDYVHKQLTSHYHRRMAMYYETIVGTQGRAGRKPDPRLVEGLEGMWDYLAYTMRPDGTGPMNNDSDKHSVVAHIVRAQDMFDRNDWRYITTNGREGERPTRLSVGYPWAGQAVMRSGWDKDAHWSFFDAGPWGAKHQHDDKLHLSVSAYGRDFLVDAGRYTYDPGAYRDYFIGSFAHNVIVVDGGEQRPGAEKAGEPLPDDWFVTEPDFDYARGAFRAGYDNIDGRVIHERAVIYIRDRFWVVVDRIESDRPRDIDVLWRFHPSCGVTMEGTDVVTNDRGQANFRITPVSGQAWNVNITAGDDTPRMMAWYAPRLNVKEPAPTAGYSARIDGSATFAWVLTPSRGAAPKVKATLVSAGEAGAKIKIGSNTIVTVPLREGTPSVTRTPGGEGE